jgi:hypothetical protein
MQERRAGQRCTVRDNGAERGVAVHSYEVKPYFSDFPGKINFHIRVLAAFRRPDGIKYVAKPECLKPHFLIKNFI